MKSVKLFFLMLLCATQAFCINVSAPLPATPFLDLIYKICLAVRDNTRDDGYFKKMMQTITETKKQSTPLPSGVAMEYDVDANLSELNAANPKYALTETSRAHGRTELPPLCRNISQHGSLAAQG